MDEESDEEDGIGSFLDSFVFLALGLSSSEEEPESESEEESEEDEDELDSAFRLTPVLGGMVGAGLSFSLSSSASLSELVEEEDEEESFFASLPFFCTFGASFMSTSESLEPLESSELLSLESSLLLTSFALAAGLPCLDPSCWDSQLAKTSTREGVSPEVFVLSLEPSFAFRSETKDLLVLL